MVRQDTHLARLSGNVDLNDVLGLVDGLNAAISTRPSIDTPIRQRAPIPSHRIQFRSGVSGGVIPREAEPGSA